MSHAIADVLGALHSRREVRSRHLHEHPARHAAELVPPLPRGERVLTRSGEPSHPLVGTDHALYVRSGHDAWRRTSWADIASVGWSRQDHCVEVRTWSADFNSSTFRVAADARFAAFVNERVSATRLLSTRAEIVPGVSGLVVAVRNGGSDVVRWQIVVDPHDAVDSAALRAGCARLIAEVRGLAGC